MASNPVGRHQLKAGRPAAILIAAVVAVVLGDAAAAQKKTPYRNYTEEKFVENMQAAGRNYAVVTDLVAGGDYESAKAQLTRAREQLAITITFWRDRQKDDAVRMLKDALNGMDGLDAALGAGRVDPAALKAASERVDAACSACHAVYREQDPATKVYRLKLRN
jgi:hypothetical protein